MLMSIRKHSVSGIIAPVFIESNGKMERLLEVARSKRVQNGYEAMLKELKTNPKNLSMKLREVVWKGKNVDDIVVELRRGKNR